jgi:hypothetical protein
MLTLWDSLTFTPDQIYVGLKLDWTARPVIYRQYRWADNTNMYNFDTSQMPLYIDERNIRLHQDACAALTIFPKFISKTLVLRGCKYDLDRERNTPTSRMKR